MLVNIDTADISDAKFGHTEEQVIVYKRSQNCYDEKLMYFCDDKSLQNL